jgi:hypothetical protein
LIGLPALLQEEYECEGIDWSHIDFVDNQDCLDTIDAKPPKGLGVMSVLDDQCNFPKSTDQSFSDTIRERIRTPRFRYRPGPHKEFVIEHYAGPVTYDCSGFLDKNRDSISVDLVKALHTSSAPICAALLPYVQLSLEGKNKATVASRFRDQLLDLVARLDQTEMHFVRCVHTVALLNIESFAGEMPKKDLWISACASHQKSTQAVQNFSKAAAHSSVLWVRAIRFLHAGSVPAANQCTLWPTVYLQLMTGIAAVQVYQAQLRSGAGHVRPADDPAAAAVLRRARGRAHR